MNFHKCVTFEYNKKKFKLFDLMIPKNIFLKKFKKNILIIFIFLEVIILFLLLSTSVRKILILTQIKYCFEITNLNYFKGYILLMQLNLILVF